MGDLDRALREIRRRDWDKMRPKWIEELALIEDVANPPDESLNKLPELLSAHQKLRDQQLAIEHQLRDAIETFVCDQKVARPALTDDQLKKARAKFTENKKRELFVQLVPLQSEIPGVWAAVFPETLRLLHKSLHVLGCAEVDADLGMRSWSLSSGYQAALFAGKALLAFCGIAIAEIGGKTLIIDTFPGPVKTAEDYVTCNISYVSSQLNHHDIWNIFQRMLGVMVCDLWPKDAVNKLKIVDARYFAKQRNDIHYDNLFWPLDDLYDFRTDGPFATTAYWNISNADIDFDREDISIVIGYYILRLAFALLTDVARYSNKLSPEIERFRSCIVQPRHPFYHTTLPIG